MSLKEGNLSLGTYAFRHPVLAAGDARVFALQAWEDKFVLPGLTQETADAVKDSGINSVAIVTDGNRTWARARGLSTREGHIQGARQLIRTIRYAHQSGIKEFSAWGASPQNIEERPEDQKKEIFETIESSVDIVIPELRKTGGAFHVIGRDDRLPGPLREKLEWGVRQTEGNHEYGVNLLIDYNNINEEVALTEGVMRRIVGKDTEESEDLKAKLIPAKFLRASMDYKVEFTENLITETQLLSDVQVIIRTGSKNFPTVYLSNFGRAAQNADIRPVPEPLPLFRTKTALSIVLESAKSERWKRKPGS